MSFSNKKPVVFLAFANDKEDAVGYLRNLPQETRRVRQVLEQAEKSGHCELVIRTNCTASDIFEVFQNAKYRDRIAIFHYGGHANGYQLLLESNRGASAAADASGFAGFLAQQEDLQLVFLNGCSTKQQTSGLLDANVAAVIATSRAIDDSIATDFACQFYQGLAGGASIQKAFLEAEAAAKTTLGGNTRGLYFEDSTLPHDSTVHPWELYVREGAERIRAWNLPEASNDPLFGLPQLPDLELPEKPYRHLDRFTREEAEIFFGRGAEIRRLLGLVSSSDSAKVVLLYGQSGVGKSSLLDAGVNPRLESTHGVKYLRRSERGLMASLVEAFNANGNNLSPNCWTQWEESNGRPLVIILDQVEEAFIHADEAELLSLVEFINETFSSGGKRPQGKLILAFRKEWLAEIESLLSRHRIARSKVHLKPLERNGIVEAIQGPATVPRMAKHFGLQIEADLAKSIADDLLADNESALAPTLQILLTKLWDSAIETDYEQPVFTIESYMSLKRQGILLRDFLTQQLSSLRQVDESLVESGLALDLLAIHTTALGTADHQSYQRLLELYPHVPNLGELLRKFQNLHLLSVHAGAELNTEGVTRLAHDTLAPLVRERFEESDKPGQRARRLLDARSPDWESGKQGAVLDDSDLATVEVGMLGTRASSEAENRLIESSRLAGKRRMRNRRILQAALVLLFLSTAIGLWLASQANQRAQSQLAETTKERNRANELAESEEEARQSAEAKTKVALRQAADATMQRAFTTRDFELDPAKASLLFAKAAEQYLKAGLNSLARSASIAKEAQVPVMSMRHPESVNGVTINQDNSFGMTQSGRFVQVWNLRTGALRKTLEMEDYVQGVKFLNSDSERALVWTSDRVNLINLDGESVKEFGIPKGIGNRLEIAEDDSRFLTYEPLNRDTTRLHLLPPFDRKLELEQKVGIERAQFISGGNRLLLTSLEGGGCTLWSAESGSLIRTFEHRGDNSRFSVDKVEKTLATWNELGEEVRIWNFENETKRDFVIPTHGVVYGARFSRDGAKLVTWGHSNASVWNLKTRKVTGKFPHSEDSGVSPGFCGESDELLFTVDTVNAISNNWSLKIWDVESQALSMVVDSGDDVTGVELASDGRQILVSGRDSTALLDLERGVKTCSFANERRGSFTNKSSQILTWADERTIRLWDLKIDSPLRSMRHQEDEDSVRASSCDVVFPQSKSTAISFGPSNDAIFWNLGGKEFSVNLPHGKRVAGGVFFADEKKILTWDEERGIKCWRVEKGAVLLESEYATTNTPIHDVKFLRNGTQFLARTGETIEYFQIGSKAPIRLFERDHGIADFEILNDKTMLSWNHEIVSVWNFDEKDPVQEYDPDPLDFYTVRGVGVKENLNQFVTVLEGEICLWEIGEKDPLSSFSLPPLLSDKIVDTVTFEEAGKRIFASATWDWSAAFGLWHENQEKHVLLTPLSSVNPKAKFLKDGCVAVWTNGSLENTISFWQNTANAGEKPFYQVTRTMAGNDPVFSADESLAITVSYSDRIVNLWHRELDSPIFQIDLRNERLENFDSVKKAEFVNNEKSALVWDWNGEISLWAIPEPRDIEHQVLESEVRTYATVSDLNGNYRLLREDEWKEKFEQLKRLTEGNLKQAP